MDDVDTETSADAPLVVEPEPEAAARPAHFGAPGAAAREGPRPAPLAARRAVLVPVVLVLLLVIAWAVDSSSGGVGRNVQLAGVDIGGLSEDELTGRVDEVAADYDETPVELVVGDVVYETTAADIGLVVDEEATTESALEVGDSSFVLARPFAWALSLFSEKQAPLQFQVNAEQVAAQVIALEGDARTPPTEPTVELVDGAFEVVPGVDGTGLDTADIARQLPGAAEAAAAEELDAVRLELEVGADPAGRLGGGCPGRGRGRRGARERAGGDHDQRRQPHGHAPTSCARGCSCSSNPDGTVVVTFDEAKAAATLRRAFADVEGHPVNASFTLEGGVPVIRADQPGTVCCTDGLRRQDPGRPPGRHPHRRARAHRRPGVVHDGRRRGVRDQGAGGRQLRLAQRRPHHRRLPASPPTTTPPAPGSPTSTAWPTSSAAP